MVGQAQTGRIRAAAASAIALLAVAAGLLIGAPADPAPASGPGPAASAAGKKQRAAKVVRRLLRCTNARRARNGREPLKVASALRRAARLHARNMARHGFFDHTDHRGRGPAERVALFNPKLRLRAISENIAAGQRSAAAACTSWMNSPGHRRNILGNHNRVGLGFWPGGTYRRRTLCATRSSMSSTGSNRPRRSRSQPRSHAPSNRPMRPIDPGRTLPPPSVASYPSRCA